MKTVNPRKVAHSLAQPTRRDVIKQGLAGILAYSVAPLVLPNRMFGATAPSNQINVGFVGMGLQCSGHVQAMLGREDVRVLAVCDVWQEKAQKYKDKIEAHYASGKRGGSYHGVDMYHKYEDLVARTDIDAVFVCTPDHWHAAVSNAAMKSGKDVYCEKPLTLTIKEGQVLVNTARKYGRILQTGSQQRSNASFRKAAEMVRNGWIGEITGIRTALGEFPVVTSLPEEKIPEGLDYDRWLGPTPWRPFNLQRMKGDFGGGWRCFYEYGARKNGDWGAHHFDIIQWALGMDHTGPVDFIPKGYQGTEYQTHIYANGIRVERVDSHLKSMIEFKGKKGTIWVSRNDYLETDPISMSAKPLSPSEVHLYASDNHHDDFLNAIVTRQRPIADVEIGHRTATVCHLNAIAERLGRPVKWDPLKEEIVGDPEASRWLDRPRRAPYAIL
jgi:predicted dehydrogenase